MKKTFISFLLISSALIASEHDKTRIKIGKFHLILGAMCTGKSKRLNDLLNRFTYAKRKFLAFKPTFDTRRLSDTQDPIAYIESRDSSKTACHAVTSWQHMQKIIADNPDVDVFGIDEVMFFADPQGLTTFIRSLIRNGKDVYAAGLKLDFLGEPFATIKELMPFAYIEELEAVCTACRQDTRCETQLLVDSKPASRHTQPGVEGSIPGHSYTPRCPNCHVIPD